jgi:hypothetical protein
MTPTPTRQGGKIELSRAARKSNIYHRPKSRGLEKSGPQKSWAAQNSYAEITLIVRFALTPHCIHASTSQMVSAK